MTDVIHAADEGIPPLAAVLVTDGFAKVRTGLSFVTRRVDEKVLDRLSLWLSTIFIGDKWLRYRRDVETQSVTRVK